MHYLFRIVAVATLVILVGACQDQPSSLIPDGAVSGTSFSGGDPRGCVERPEEAASHRLADGIPGFGGFSVDEDGSIVGFVIDLGRADEARAALEPLRERLLAERPGRGGEIRIRQGLFDFHQLCVWRDQFFETVLDMPGVVHTGINQLHNKLNVGAVDGAAEARVRQELVRLGVPAAAVRFRRAHPILRDDTLLFQPFDQSQPFQGTALHHYYRPLLGGFQIGWREPTTTVGHYIPCTLGFNAILDSGARAIVTNAHCSEKMWDLDTTSYSQPHPGVDRYVGHEIRDPRANSCGFLSLYVCRNSDASAVYVDPAVSTGRGFIARTVGLGSVVIDHANPPFRIIQKGPHASGGDLVDRVGPMTGWTRGQVVAGRTCEDTKHDRSWSKLRCQTFATYHSAGGDSGSPVFRRLGGGDVALVGIHWGREGTTGHRIFSPIARVEMDLGTMAVLDPTYEPPPPPPPPPPGECDPSYIICPVEPL
jgi:hypothetical protein